MPFRSAVVVFLCVLATAPALAQGFDLSITKTGPTTAPRNNIVTYTIDVTNTSATASGAVTVSDPVTGGWSFVSVAPPAGFTCTDPGNGATSGTVTCTASSLPGSSTSSFLIFFHIPAGTPIGTTFTNTATVSSPGDTNNQNDSSSVQTEVVASADLSVVKTGPAIANADTDVAFNIAVTNNGPDDSGPLSLNDPVIGGWSFVSVTPPAGWGCSDPGTGATTGTVSCSASDLPAGMTVNFTIVFHIPPGTPAGTSFTNQATVNSESDLDVENNTGSATTSTPPLPVADAGIVKSGPASAAPDTDVAFTITVANAGPSAAQNVSWTDTLPGGLLAGMPPTPQPALTFVSINQNSGPAFSCAGGATTTCSLASMPAGTTATFTLVAHVPSGIPTGTGYTNTATVSSDSGDPNEENDSSSTALTIVSADVSVTKSAPATAIAGGPAFDYVITVSNGGPDTAIDVAFSDPLPAGIVFVSMVQNNGPLAMCGTPAPNTNGSVDCGIPLLGNGQSAQFTITVRALPSVANGTVAANTVTVTTSSADLDPSDNSSAANTTIAAQADLSIVKSGPPTAVAGADITYTIAVSNGGPSNALNVSWSDPLPANTTFVSLAPNTGPAFTCSTGATVSCSLASFAAGSSATFTLIVHVSPATANGTLITNSATVTSSTTETNSANNTSTVSTTAATSADLSVVKTGPAFTPSNTQVTYTVTVANAGPSDAANVTLTDNVPASMTFASVSQTAGPTFSCSANTCTIASFAAGASATFQFVFNVPPSVTPGTATTNTATVSAATADPNTGNNNSSVPTTITTPIPALSPILLALLAASLALFGLRRTG